MITLPAFILQLPLFFILIACVKLDSKGPAFYKARAIGKGGRPFDMYKFRSMFVDSEKAIHQQYVTKLQARCFQIQLFRRARATNRQHG